MSSLLGRVLGLLWRFLRVTFPYIVKVVMFVGEAMLTTLIATFRGWGPVANKIATEMSDDILDHFLLPERYAKVLNWFFLTVAYFTLVVGWVTLSYLTVFLVRLIF